MNTKEVMRRICAVLVIVALVGYYSGYGVYAKADTEVTKSELSEKEESPDQESKNGEIAGNDEVKHSVNGGEAKNYIVRTKSKKSLSKIRRKYSESSETNENKQDLLEEEKVISLELSDSAIQTLAEDDSVVYIEEDAIVEASANGTKEKKTHIKSKKPHKIKKKVLKKNSSSTEWNVRMIKADKHKEENAERIKVAILDSGIDWGNDINLRYQISLVPGEEEMTQIFMDGTGHGSSVASLIAASDDENGITGINSNVDIYSYRVLDDGNQAPVSRVAEAIYMAIEQDVNIINMSFGLNDYSETLEEAVHAAREAGILVIAAAGNTGSEGVQYPAAFEDVMAVGAVNKDGIVEEYSAKGEEVEIVAPGELIRTTGFIGTEEVTSGTSLAAPQIAAVATLIWQKDTGVSADFVRGLLDESANLYGETDEYGNGLVDAEYALNHYDEYKQKYKESVDKSKQIISVNESEITTFSDTGCVEGSWTQDDHELMVESDYFNVRYGARFPDTSRYGDEDHRVFARMTLNPWWHGYYETNYIKAVLYATRMGDAINKYGLGQQGQAETLGYSSATEMRNDIGEIKWSTELSRINSTYNKSQKDTKGFRRAFIWGMAIHSATDIFAHSAYEGSTPIKHTKNSRGKLDADDPEKAHERFVDANTIAQQMMKKYKAKAKLEVTDLILPYGAITYKIRDLYRYVEEASNKNTALLVTGYSYSPSTK